MAKQLLRFGLSVAADKTRLMHFSPQRTSRKHSITFLGFSLYWSRSMKGKACLRHKTSKKKLHESMNEFYRWIKLKRSVKLNLWLPELRRKLMGWRNYFGLKDNSDSLNKLYYSVLNSLFKWLNRRSQRRSYNWEGLLQMLAYNGITPIRVRSRFTYQVAITRF